MLAVFSFWEGGDKKSQNIMSIIVVQGSYIAVFPFMIRESHYDSNKTSNDKMKYKK